MCVKCESDWASDVSHGATQNPYRAIEGLDFIGCIFTIDARMVSGFNSHSNTDTGDGDTRSAGHSDNGQIFSCAVVGNDGDLGNYDHSDNGRRFSGAVVDDGDAGRAGHSDNGQPILRAVVNNDRDTIKADHSDNGQVFSGAVDDSVSFAAAPAKSVAGPFDCVSIVGLGLDTAGCAESCTVTSMSTNHQEFDYHGNHEDRDSTFVSFIAESMCESPNGSVEDFPKAIYAPIPCAPLTIDWDAFNLETFGLEGDISADIDIPQETLIEIPAPYTSGPDLLDEFIINIKNLFEERPEVNNLTILERIDETVRKQIDEETEKERRGVTLSKLLDDALLQKDRNDRREREAAQGIEEDPHLWDTESIEQKLRAEIVPIHEDASAFPCTTLQVRSDSPFPGPQPTMHLYLGNMFAGTEEEAYQMGLREVRPYMGHEGEWEGMMRAFSADDANRMGLLDPVHLRGCCDELPVHWHLYYGMMYADSEFDAEKRHLEDIQRVPGSKHLFYGTLPADDVAHAHAMGLSDVKHLWGCCKDGRVDMPLAVTHRYHGVMSAISIEDVLARRLLDPQPVPGDCGDYYGGLYSGYVEANCELDAWNMGLRKIEHVDCYVEVEDRVESDYPKAQCTFYGYMVAHTEQEIVDRGLQCALLVPGPVTKYSGNLQASSAAEAKAMGLIEPSRIEWTDLIPAGFF